jgi:hypothetical protein
MTGTKMILTRYLYDKSKVINSLIESIKKHYYDESLFWAYELYFSGFQEEVIICLENIYKMMFSKNHPKLGLYISKKKAESHQKPELVATIIKNLTMKNPQIPETQGVKFVNVKEHHILPFMTKEEKMDWKFLREVCSYGVLGKASKEELSAFRENWVYHASGSPIWSKRIELFDGKIGDNIIFEDDEREEAFYDKYGYEPDEQPLEIQQRCIGIF